MAKQIRYNYLNKPELEYEVAIRHETPADNVVSLKEQIVRLSSIKPAEVISSSPLAPSEDLCQASTTLNYIKEKCSLLESSGDVTLSKKIESFLNHLHYRLDRINISSDDSLTIPYKTLRTDFYSLKKRFETTLDPDLEPHLTPDVEILQEPENLPSVSQPSSPKIVPPVLPTTIPTCSSYVQPTYLEAENNDSNVSIPQSLFRSIVDSLTKQPHSTSPNITKDLKNFTFHGKSCPRSFLQKLEEFCISRNIPEDDLVKYAFEIFKGDALHWFRFQSNYNTSLTWSEIKNLLIRDFGVRNYDFKLYEAIRNRTQGEDESIIIYVSIMSGMFSRLTKKISEAEKLEILLNNIRPCYSMTLLHTKITTIHSLISVCQAYEDCITKSRSFREPSTNIDPCAQEFAYKPSTSKSSNSSYTPKFNVQNTREQRFKTNNTQYHPQSTNVISKSNFTQNKDFSENFCLRCRIKGHTLDSCREPRYLVCFKCGLKDVKISNCPNCNSNQKN